MKPLLTPKQASELLQVSVSTIYRMINKGELKCFPSTGEARLYAEQFEMPTQEDPRVKRIWG